MVLTTTMSEIEDELKEYFKTNPIVSSWQLHYLSSNGQPLGQLDAMINGELKENFPEVVLYEIAENWRYTLSVAEHWGKKNQTLMTIRIKRKRDNGKMVVYDVILEGVTPTMTVQDLVNNAVKAAAKFYDESRDDAEEVVRMFRSKGITPQEIKDLHYQYCNLSKLTRDMVDKEFGEL